MKNKTNLLIAKDKQVLKARLIRPRLSEPVSDMVNRPGLALTLEADSVNVQALNMGRIVVDVDGVNLAELINKVAENGDSLRVVDERDSTETPATYASPHQLL